MYSFAMQSQRDSAQVIHSNARSSENNRELMEQWVMCLLLTFKSEYCFLLYVTHWYFSNSATFWDLKSYNLILHSKL